MGVGVRAGFNPGFTAKYMLSDKTALEGLAQFRYHGFALTGLYEIHVPAFDEDNLKWYYGGGAHVGYYASPRWGWGRYKRNPGYPIIYDFYPTIGLDAILGLEYKIEGIPFTVSADFKPYVDLYYPALGLFDLALSARYVF